MKPESATTLAITAAICIVLGTLIPAPTGSMAGYVLAATCALAAATFGQQKTRIAAVVLLAVSGAMIVTTWPAWQAEMTRYRAAGV